ncbi:MAG TPA: fibronectin type III domain-containing protein [Candidatus Nitrosotalea sp.]|nr:fibronectin type III domain-containing protein [Candidatus Nitrosotalea sp.]
MKTFQLLTLVFSFILIFSVGVLVQNAFADKVVATIPMNGVWDITVNPATNTVYVGDNDYHIQVINGSTNTVTDIVTTNQTSYNADCSTRNIAVNPLTNLIYTSNGGCNYNNGQNVTRQSISVINSKTNAIVTVLNLPSPFAEPSLPLAVNTKTNKIYVCTTLDLYVIDGTTNTIVNNLSLGTGSQNVAVNPVTNMIYMTHDSTNTVSVINGSTDKVISTLAVGTFPTGVAVNPITNMIYVSNESGGVSVINGTKNIVMSTIPVGNGPTGIAVNPVTNKIYVTNTNDNSVSVIDGKDNTVLSTMPIGNSPSFVDVNPTTNMIYVGNLISQSISVIDGSTPITSVAPSSPQNLSATAVSRSQIDLSWTAPSNNGGSPVVGYKIDRLDGTIGNSTMFTIVTNTDSNATAYNDTGLAPSVIYKYQVSAINSVGTSLPSNVASATTLNTVPSSPTNLAATGKKTHIDLSWTIPIDNGGTPIIGYVIQRSTDNGTTWDTIVQNTNSTGTTYTDSHLKPVQTYTYRVSAINSVGKSEPSNTASIRPLAPHHGTTK